MMSPSVYEEARRTAPIHVQILVTGLRRPGPGVASVKARGRVVRVFRDRSRSVRLGRSVSFFVSVIASSDEPPMPSGEIHHGWDRLTSSIWWEVFLYPLSDGFELVRSQVAPIRRPTLRPVCGPNVEGYCCEGNVKLTRKTKKTEGE